MWGVCIIGCLYWKLVYVAVNVGSVPNRVCVLEICVYGCKCEESGLYGVCTGNYFVILRETNNR